MPYRKKKKRDPAIPATISCPECGSTMHYLDLENSQAYSCENALCANMIRRDQLIEESPEKNPSAHQGNTRPYIKSFGSSDDYQSDYEDSTNLFKQESKKYIGSPDDALKADLEDMKKEQQQNIEERRYQATDTSQESELRRFREKQERDRQCQ